MTTDSANDEGLPDKIRTPREVATRALVLFSAVAAALGAPREEIIHWLREHQLWTELSRAEEEFLTSSTIERQAKIDFGWQSERLLVLLWALKKIEELPGPGVQADTAVFQEILPPFADISVTDFLQSSSIRSDEILLAKCDELLDQHWHARDAKLNARAAPDGIDIEIVQERHQAINWVTGYCGLAWDDVTTDT